MRRCISIVSLLAVLLFVRRAMADELPLRLKKQEQLLLVLNTGRVVQGHLIPRPGGYDVNLPTGRLFVPASQIRFTATSMDDAYHSMRKSLREFTPDAHLSLARWCLTNQLTSRARGEILDALKLDPYRDDARRMLQNIVREQQRVIEAAQPSPEDTPAEQQLLPDRRSLGGLPPELAQRFTQRVQPILSARCGNSRCHGDGRNSFTVVHSLRRSTAQISELNLAAVLKHIDFQAPENSSLL